MRGKRHCLIVRAPERLKHKRIHAAAGQAVGRGLRARGKETGSDDGQKYTEPRKTPETRRRSRRPGNRDLPRPLEIDKLAV